ncbi:MAG: T9SS type A sorting domain-containing protein [Saprospiraceae bacterium]
MKNTFTFLLLILPFLIIAQSDYEIINVIPAPTSTTLDITNDGTFIYMKSNSKVYKIDPVDGGIVNEFDITNLTGLYGNGIAYGDDHLWIGGRLDDNKGIIRKVDPVTGDVVQSIEHSISEFTHGMQIVGDELFVNFFFGGVSDTIFVLDFDGNVLDKYPTDLNYSHGFAFDGNDYWLTSNTISGGSSSLANIYRLDPITLEKIDTFDCPGQFYPNGITAFQNSLWIADNGTDSIYQIKIDIDVAINNLAEKDISLFPNPVQDYLEIDLGKNYNDLEVRIVNLNGQLLMRKEYDNQIKLRLETPFPSGIYFAEVISEKKNLGIFKIVKE